MRLIDADAMMEELKTPVLMDNEKADRIWEGWHECTIALKEAIDRTPTIERKKGKWIPHIEKYREYIGTVLVHVEYDYWLCDICGYRVEKGQPMYNFCPNCGADMRGET